LKIKIRHLNRFIFHKLGLHIETAKKSATLSGLLKLATENKLSLDVIFDVGAFKGLWSKEVRKSFPRSEFYLFEPNLIHNEQIKELGFTPINLLLGSDSSSKVDFFSTGNTGDSYFKEKNSVYDLPPQERYLTSLADFITNNGLAAPDFLKLDTQGSELEILKGMGRYLGDVTLILVELPISGMNIGAPSLSEITRYLEDHDFVPVHLTESHYLIDILVQVDIAFMNRKKFNEVYKHDDIYHRA
jgi:FkbM family methyltransferase